MAATSALTFAGGRNVAMKVPPHQWEKTVAFYRDTLGVRELHKPLISGRRPTTPARPPSTSRQRRSPL